MRYVLYVAGAVLLLWLLPLMSAWLRLRRLRFRPGARASVAAASDLPPELAPLFDAAARQLGTLGFAYTHAQWSDSIAAGDARRPAQVFVHAETSTYAVVTPPVFHNGRRLFAVAFTTTFRSGHVLTTMDALLHLTPVPPPSREWRDHYLNDVAAQWAAHRAAVRERARFDGPVRLDPEEFARQEQAALGDAIDRGWREGLFRRGSEAAPRLSARAAWRLGRSMMEGARRVARMRSARVASEDAEAWLAADVYAFAAAESHRTTVRTVRAKALLFVVSGALSAAAIGLLFSWELVPALFAVLLVHELGHLAGMWLFGFRDRQMLFLPLIGAAAIGRKDDATAAQKLIVLLLGPVPGIVLGAVCLWVAAVTRSVVWHEIGMLALVLNYVNLLPVTPLDGGRIVELLFLQRMPLAGVAFLLVSAVVAGLAGLALGDGVLVGLSLLMLGAVPARWRVASAVHAAVRRLPARAARGDHVRAAFQALDERVGRAATAVRLQLARAVVEHLEARPASAALATGGGAAYALLLALPLAASLAYADPAPTYTAAACEAADREMTLESPAARHQAGVGACGEWEVFRLGEEHGPPLPLALERGEARQREGRASSGTLPATTHGTSSESRTTP